MRSRPTRRIDPDLPAPLRRLTALKMKMSTGKDFSEIYGYFFDHFGENNEFLTLGKEVSHPLLKMVITQLTSTIFKKKFNPPQHSKFIHLPDQRFLHGSCIFPGVFAVFFYFEDLDSGMAALNRVPSSGRIEYARFSVRTSDKMPPHAAN
jgi:hypothetical protein